MKVPITEVPQADELKKVLATVEAVYNGSTSDTQIAAYIGFTDRQGRYYRLAAEILGLLDNSNNNATLTALGEELIVLDENNRLKKIRTILKATDIFGRVLSFLEGQEAGANREQIITFLKLNINGAESTIARRYSTIVSWLISSALIQLDIRAINDTEEETVYKFNDQLEEGDFWGNDRFADSIYPTSYADEELDIKESHTQVVTLLRRKIQGKIIVPEFQRNQVWKQQQKSRFVESLILNIPIPAFYISQDLEGNMIIVDGLQRSMAIFDFLEDKYSLVGLEALPALNGRSYSDLEMPIKARIEDRELLLYILKPTVPMAIVYDIFNRINSNGTPLTRQEIRNCIYIGQSTRLLAELAESELFKLAIDHGISWLRMKDREAVLRFLAFILYKFDVDYKGDLDDFLGKTMRKINRMSSNEIESLKERFLRVMSLTYSYFGDANFRLPIESGRGRINIAVMETVTVFFDDKSDAYLEMYKSAIKWRYFNTLLQDSEYIQAVRISTGTERNVKTRFRKTFEILGNDQQD